MKTFTLGIALTIFTLGNCNAYAAYPGLTKDGYKTVRKDSYSAPKPAYQAPKSVYEAPKPAYQAPKVTYEAPKSVYEAPKPAYQAPKVTYEAPKSVYEAPKPVYEAPKPPVYHKSQVSKKSEYRTPKKSYKASQKSYESKKSYTATKRNDYGSDSGSYSSYPGCPKFSHWESWDPCACNFGFKKDDGKCVPDCGEHEVFTPNGGCTCAPGYNKYDGVHCTYCPPRSYWQAGECHCEWGLHFEHGYCVEDQSRSDSYGSHHDAYSAPSSHHDAYSAPSSHHDAYSAPSSHHSYHDSASSHHTEKPSYKPNNHY